MRGVDKLTFVVMSTLASRSHGVSAVFLTALGLIVWAPAFWCMKEGIKKGLRPWAAANPPADLAARREQWGRLFEGVVMTGVFGLGLWLLGVYVISIGIGGGKTFALILASALFGGALWSRTHGRANPDQRLIHSAATIGLAFAGLLMFAQIF